MIRTEFMTECENCPHLEVTLHSITMQRWGASDEYLHTIACEHTDKCELIKEHLKKELIKNGNK